MQSARNDPPAARGCKKLNKTIHEARNPGGARSWLYPILAVQRWWPLVGACVHTPSWMSSHSNLKQVVTNDLPVVHVCLPGRSEALQQTFQRFQLRGPAFAGFYCIRSFQTNITRGDEKRAKRIASRLAIMRRCN